MRFTLFLIVLFTQKLLAQEGRNLPLGAWRYHTPYTEAFGLERLGDRVFAATPSGLFSYHLEDQSIGILNKVNGLTDVGLTAMSKHPTQPILMVGYENGTLDLIENNRIINLKDIFLANIQGSKRINSIRMSGNRAYVSGDFGIAIMNIRRREVIQSNLNLGAQGNSIRVLDCVPFQDSVYALTAEGLKGISIRADFKNTTLWKTYSGANGLPADPNAFYKIDSLNNELIVTTSAGLFFKNKNSDLFTWRLILGELKRSLRFINGKYILCLRDNVLEYDANFSSPPARLDGIYYKKISRPSDVYYTGNLKFISDLDNGLLLINGADTTQILPNSPRFSGGLSLYSYKNEVLFLPGGYSYPTGANQSNNFNGFAIFKENVWRTYKPGLQPNVPIIKDYVHAFFHTPSQKLYLSSFGNGIVEKKEDNYFLLNDRNTNGGLCNVIFSDCIWNKEDPNDAPLDSAYVRISSSIIDVFGNLWATNYEGRNGSIRVRSAADGSWRRILLPYSNQGFPLEILADQNNCKWVRMAPLRENGNAGIWVLNGDGSRRLELNTNSTQGRLPSNDVYDIKEDKSGYIWVGTGKGLAVFYNPINAFALNGISASTPIFPPEAGRPVLENDVVTAIEIDGSNRKWVGTRNNGLWLFNADITKQIQHFTTRNSPLPSDNILDIAINKPTGEVFIVTERGLVSYQSDASEKLDDLGNPLPNECSGQDLVVFPNPVKKEFSGLIAINGLANNATVKVVTASGKLVYETNSKGGMATWNGRTYDGKKAQPGIYLILASTADGTTNCFTKLAIVD